MNVKDMTDLITIYDGVEEIEKIMELLCGTNEACGYNEGALGKLSNIFNVIHRNSKLYKPDYGELDNIKDEHGNSILDILDMKISAEERAKMLI